MDWEDAILSRQESEADECSSCEYRGHCHNECNEVEIRYLNFETMRYEKKYPTIIDYDYNEHLEYLGTDDGHIFYFDEYAVNQDGYYEFIRTNRMLTRREIKNYVNGPALLHIIDNGEEME